MKIQPKIALISVLTALSLVACGQDDSEPTSANSRFSRVTVDDQTCIQDNQTGLLWESKTDRGGLRDYRHTYSWWNPEEARGELDYRGTEDGGECSGSSCDTWHFVNAVNQASYCGHDDWRMPYKDELFSISDLSRAKSPPTIDTALFPHTAAAEYWSGNDYSFQWDAAWAWNFQFGHDRVDWKKTPKFVRLVSGSGENLPEVKE